MSVFFIAEAGVNHNGDKDMAFALIDAAAEAGADAVKFQTFTADELASETAPKAAYQNATTDASESQLDMLRRLELPHDWHAPLRDYCAGKGIEFLSTPFDTGSLRFLADEVGLKTIKVPSGEITNGPFLLRIAETGRDIILSTGMSDLDEVRDALGVLAFGLTGSGAASAAAFSAAYDTDAGKAALREKVTVLQCTSAYPTPLAEANVRAMVTMREAFGLRTGFSDHTEGTSASFAATALGADVIEKHFTLDRQLPGPDHKASLEPGELKELIDGIRAIETSLGDGIKTPQASEIETATVARKSLIALEEIGPGEPLTEANLGAKRPGDGLSPMRYWDIVGGTAARRLKPGDPI
ncbi:MAG: N-acetylneuraminate synthase [Rhodospirillales bacterium]|nr:N-acetylneuraminate synthase [Rhodospirillales bacterium]MBO6787743.1 N-acetylneuraminate synthase [Rhodospirillales bacterium]